MINQQQLKGQWNEIRGKLRSHWGQLTSDDVQTFNGNVDQLIGLIQRKTGEARGTVEEYLESLMANGGSVVQQATETVREYATAASEQVQEGARRASETVRRGYGQAEDMIRQRPSESAAVCFGVGMAVGVLLSMMLSRR